MVGAVGSDKDGDDSIAALQAEGIDVSGIRRVDAPTGVAIIAVGGDGENQIVVAPGANALVSADDASLGDMPPGPGVMLASLEVPMQAVVAAVLAARGLGMPAIVNPGPAYPLAPELLASGAILTPNADELLEMTGAADVEVGVSAFIGAGARAVVVMLGSHGALLAEGRRRRLLSALAVEAIDTTGAGDTFSGVLAAWLASGHDLDEAVDAANLAAGLSVTHRGARDGMPNRAAIEAAMRG
jgi:ribokinase